MSRSIEGLIFLRTRATFWHRTKSESTTSEARLFHTPSDPWRVSPLTSKNRRTPTLADHFPATLLPAQRPASRKTLPGRKWPIGGQELLQAQAGIQLQELQASQTQLKPGSSPHHVALQCHFCMASLYSYIPPASRDTHFAPMSVQMCCFDVLLWCTPCLDHEKPFKVLRLTKCEKSQKQLVYKFE